jgi:hypothetical protein
LSRTSLARSPKERPAARKSRGAFAFSRLRFFASTTERSERTEALGLPSAPSTDIAN